MYYFEEKNFIEQYGPILASVIASVVALSIAIWGWKMRKWFKRPKFEVIGIKKYKQSEILNVWRILIKNCGNDIAENVEAEIMEIFEDEEKRKNFLPSPLRWTHRQDTNDKFTKYNPNRNITPGQIAFLDLFDEIHKDGIRIRIASILLLDNIEDFSRIRNGKTIVRVAVFQKEFKPAHIEILCNLDEKTESFNVLINTNEN